MRQGQARGGLERIAIVPPAGLLPFLSPGLKRGRLRIKSLENLRDRRLTPAMPGHHDLLGTDCTVVRLHWPATAKGPPLEPLPPSSLPSTTEDQALLGAGRQRSASIAHQPASLREDLAVCWPAKSVVRGRSVPPFHHSHLHWPLTAHPYRPCRFGLSVAGPELAGPHSRSSLPTKREPWPQRLVAEPKVSDAVS